MNSKELYIYQAQFLGLGDLTKIKTGKARTELINKIADIYCDAADNKDESYKNYSFAALMLLFWGEIGKIATKCKAVGVYEYDDFVQELGIRCMLPVLNDRPWKSGEHNAEQCIRQVIASRGAAAILYESNLDKNKANINTYSLDATVNDDEGRETTRLDLLEDNSEDFIKSTTAVKLLIQGVIDKGDIFAGIILDNIAFNDCLRDIKKTKTVVETETGKEYKVSINTPEFSENFLVRTLMELPKTYKKYFMENYSVKENILGPVLKRFKALNSTKMHKTVKEVLAKQKLMLKY